MLLKPHRVGKGTELAFPPESRKIKAKCKKKKGPVTKGQETDYTDEET